ncbi:hypothetical protein ACFZAG_37390 [Streptomyces sp. NPDC012403]|uniref:hypothetical protein n=1 Tax=unclassified Streptomyces TaxID=2593676 RepID=UPI003456DAAA
MSPRRNRDGILGSPGLRPQRPPASDGALAWAAAAGVPVTAQRSEVEELLRSHETFVEDLFGALLDKLGFAQPEHPSPAP